MLLLYQGNVNMQRSYSVIIVIIISNVIVVSG